jgi:hypothetical protein
MRRREKGREYLYFILRIELPSLGPACNLHALHTHRTCIVCLERSQIPWKTAREGRLGRLECDPGKRVRFESPNYFPSLRCCKSMDHSRRQTEGTADSGTHED